MPIWLAASPLVLASKSKVRRSLLAAAGIPIDVQAAELDERAIEGGAATNEPSDVARHLAREKALVVGRSHPQRLVLGADQVLALDGKRFTKPPDRTAARAQLRALSGRTHSLHSAVACVQNGVVAFEHVGVARLTMRTLSGEFLEAYLDAAVGAAMESVGAYQLEGLGSQLFERVEGDYFAILGLPLLEVLGFLRRHGSLLP
jgi:nucleoside triphosphate pyrophosphatase